ncbi:hypothetical protein JVT61DRAFT_12421 [Boletus reticuloceps]|uniref:HMG box domain-containing protein n=1 Tax=Boletus reticuloceps TaxID=495285 RepID=A0A8I2YDV9_9AGAM|nr:hypothetical protein JVT61DRAFT_12421 [Boletus reticuloceps]
MLMHPAGAASANASTSHTPQAVNSQSLNGLLQAYDFVREAKMHNPQQLDVHGEKCLLVVKNGLATGTTIGRVNGLESFRCTATFLMLATRVWSPRQRDRVVGILTGGSAPNDELGVKLNWGGFDVAIVVERDDKEDAWVTIQLSAGQSISEHRKDHSQDCQKGRSQGPGQARQATEKKAKSSQEGKPPKKQRVRVPKSLKPPKRAPGPYFLFYASFLKSQPQANSLHEFQEFSRRAGEIWRGYSMAEMQPFYDEHKARKAQAKQEREEIFRNTSLSDLKQLNAIRKAQGKTKFHLTKKSSIPVTLFILFSNEFRSSTEG